MPYLRTRGRQLVIAHGERDPESQKVEQRILFTLYSKGEALEMLGKRGDGKGAPEFERLLGERYPDIRFDWKRIRADVKGKMDVLPDLYDYRSARLRDAIRPAVAGLTKALIVADPQSSIASAEIIAKHRYELEFVRELIEWRLEVCDDQERSEFNADNPFYWQFALRGGQLPPEAEEIASEYWERRELDRAESVFRLLCEAFHPYAEGHNYLGLIALERRDFDEAARQFELTIELGRKLFPKRISKKSYWSNHDTRPYLRGLRNLLLTYNRMGRFADALELCERLEGECGDVVGADTFRASIYMNTGEFERAAAKATNLVEVWPSEGFVVGFALCELGRSSEALPYLVNAILACPRTARMLVGLRSSSVPNEYFAIEDHNTGVELRDNLHVYLVKQSPATERFLKKLLKDARLQEVADELEAATRRWFVDRTNDRRDFDVFNRIRGFHFAEELASEMASG